MEHKVLFQDLPLELQDELRDAPIVEVGESKVVVETVSYYKNMPQHFQVILTPKSMDDDSIVYATQDLQDIEVSILPIHQTVPA